MFLGRMKTVWSAVQAILYSERPHAVRSGRLNKPSFGTVFRVLRLALWRQGET